MKREPMEARSIQDPVRSGPGWLPQQIRISRTVKSGEGSLLWSAIAYFIHNEEEVEGRSHVDVNREEATHLGEAATNLSYISHNATQGTVRPPGRA